LEAEKDDHFSSLYIDVSGDRMASWAANFTGNLPAQTLSRTMDYIIIPTNKPFLQPAHTEQGFCATRKVCRVSRSPLRRLYWKTVTVLSWHRVLTTRQREHPNPERSPSLSLSCLISRRAEGNVEQI
jgi:hypothetical protein